MPINNEKSWDKKLLKTKMRISRALTQFMKTDPRLVAFWDYALRTKREKKVVNVVIVFIARWIYEIFKDKSYVGAKRHMSVKKYAN